MPWGRDADDTEGADSPRLSLGERLKSALLKPEDPDAPRRAGPAIPETAEEIQAELKTMSDKERAIGLIGAPLAAAIGFLVITSLIDNDPAATFTNGRPNPAHVSVSLYHELTFVLLGLAVAMLLTAWYRKRLFTGIAMVCYGLAVFNLKYWGFGIPFVLGAAWYLIRSFRLQRALREATGDLPGRGTGSRRSNGSRPSSNKRYTPPTSSKRPSRPKLEGDQPPG